MSTDTAGAEHRAPRVQLSPDRVKELTLLAVIVGTVLLFSVVIDDYPSGRFLTRVTTSVAITGVLAIGQTLVIITRNIDLSVASIVGLTAFVTGDFVSQTDASAVVVVLVAIAIGCGLGMFNGLLVTYGRVPAIIVTLGTLAIYRTGLILYADATSITTADLPTWLVELPRVTLFTAGGFQLRLAVVVTIVVVVVLQIALSKLRVGRRLYAIGSNPDAARQAGLPERRLVLTAFTLSGGLAGLAGFLFLARFGTITVVAGRGLELEAIAAAVVGGVSILGGSGTLFGALLGATLIDLLDQSLIRVEQISEFWQDAFLGALILLAVIADVAINQRFRMLVARRLRTGDARASKAPTVGDDSSAGTRPGTSPSNTAPPADPDPRDCSPSSISAVTRTAPRDTDA